MGRRGRRLGALLLGWAALASAASAGEYRSGFGFAITVPDVWLVLTRDEVTRHADLFLEDEGDAELRAIPLAMRRAVFERVEAGELEIFYRRDETVGPFVDNVNVMHQPAALPGSEAELAQLCELLPIEFSRVFGRPISMEVCEMRERVGRPALYLQFDGAVAGTTTLQYQLLRRGGSTLVFTATATRDHLPRLMSEFEEMVGSVRLP